MKAEWALDDVPALLEDAGRNTAENATRSLPLVRAIGDVRRVTVVTSAWHIRTPYFFAPYRSFGLGLSFALERHGPWLGHLVDELGEGRGSRRAERRLAMAAMRLPGGAGDSGQGRERCCSRGAWRAPGPSGPAGSRSRAPRSPPPASGEPPRAPDEAIEGILAPGLCDLQVNGAGGHEVSDGPAALDEIDADPARARGHELSADAREPRTTRPPSGHCRRSWSALAIPPRPCAAPTSRGRS